MSRDSIRRTKLGSAYTAQGLLPHSIQPVSFSLCYVTLSQSVQLMGPTIEDLYRLRENRPVRWKRLRALSRKSSRDVSTWARFFVSKFKRRFVRIYRDVYNWSPRSIINLWSEIFVIEDSLLDHRSLFLTRSNQSILLFIFLFFIILIYYINLFINIKIFTYLLHKYKLTIMVLLILNNPPIQFLLLLILLLLDFRLADLYSRIFRIDNSFYSW